MPKDSLYHRSVAIIAYNEDMTLRKYITVEKGYKNSYDIYQWSDEFDYNAYDSYSEFTKKVPVNHYKRFFESGVKTCQN